MIFPRSTLVLISLAVANSATVNPEVSHFSRLTSETKTPAKPVDSNDPAEIVVIFTEDALDTEAETPVKPVASKDPEETIIIFTEDALAEAEAEAEVEVEVEVEEKIETEIEKETVAVTDKETDKETETEATEGVGTTGTEGTGGVETAVTEATEGVETVDATHLTDAKNPSGVTNEMDETNPANTSDETSPTDTTDTTNLSEETNPTADNITEDIDGDAAGTCDADVETMKMLADWSTEGTVFTKELCDVLEGDFVTIKVNVSCPEEEVAVDSEVLLDVVDDYAEFYIDVANPTATNEDNTAIIPATITDGGNIFRRYLRRVEEENVTSTENYKEEVICLPKSCTDDEAAVEKLVRTESNHTDCEFDIIDILIDTSAGIDLAPGIVSTGFLSLVAGAAIVFW